MAAMPDSLLIPVAKADIGRRLDQLLLVLVVLAIAVATGMSKESGMAAIQRNARKGLDRQTDKNDQPAWAGWSLHVGTGHGPDRERHQRKRRSTRVPLVPPNPKEFESATSMSISRASLAQ